MGQSILYKLRPRSSSSESSQQILTMDAIRKKMQSLKAETDTLYKTIAGFEEATAEAVARADKSDCDIRDYGKKVQQLDLASTRPMISSLRLMKPWRRLRSSSRKWRAMCLP